MDSSLPEILRDRLKEPFTRLDRGDLILPWILRPCRLKILMVVDGYPGSFLNVSFSHSYFGLSAVLDTLRDNPEYFVKFDVTRAHRQTDTFKPDPATQPELHARYGPHFEGFRFTQAGFDLDDYDQVWLFGARSNPNDVDRLTDAELEILADWMDRGGGVFATGDHADLGASLCARIPRVRSMRKWTTAQGVPSPVGMNRHDTNLRGHNVGYTFDDESDDVPMTISPRYYPLSSWSPFIRRQAPHPVLCGVDGVIDVLPDHPHEGEVIDGAAIDLTRTVTFGSYSAAEYPAASGVQPRPEVIAWAHVQGDHTSASDSNKGAASPKTFGVLGTYDGHGIDAGRVVVDSTWHHWFDVNLTGRPVDALDSYPADLTNPKVLGFLATTAGRSAYARIQNFFRNVGMWLASEPLQRCMFFRATWGGVIRYPLVERLDPSLPIWELGQAARDAIGRRAGQCTLSYWVKKIFPVEVVEIFEPRPDPCLTCPPFDLLEVFTLGGIAREMLRLAYDVEIRGEVNEKSVAAAFVRGAAAGGEELAKSYAESMDRSRESAERLYRMGRTSLSEGALLDIQRLRPPGGKGKGKGKGKDRPRRPRGK